MNTPNRIPAPVVHHPQPGRSYRLSRTPATPFSFGIASALAMWVYMVLALAVLPTNSLSAHLVAIGASIAAGIPLEWLRSRGSRDYATVFLILVTLAPLLYRYQHG